MDRRNFLINGSGLAAGTLFSGVINPFAIDAQNSFRQQSRFSHRLPKTDVHYNETCGYVEDDPVPNYTWASDQAYEDFMDIKFGIRLHWGIYSILQLRQESWPFLDMTFAERQTYQELHKSWYPAGFDANEWVGFFSDSGARMFAFTSKHHDGFSMFDTKTRVKKRMNWLAPGGPAIEDCDVAYSIMETPFKRDIVKELSDAAHKKGMKVDFYFSHPDWYDTDFRPYNYHPVQVPGAATLAVEGKEKRPEMEEPEKRYKGAGLFLRPDPSPEEVNRMMKRHRQQIEEILTKYGKIDMMCLDQWLGPTVWPQLRETMLYLRSLQPDVMFRARGIGNYGDYYTPEGFVPGSKENSDTPWFVIYPLGETFSFEAEGNKYKGTPWIVKNLVDAVAKGGNFMVGIGPNGHGKFHEEAVKQLLQAGKWLKINGEGIYATRARTGDLWKEGEHVRFTRSKDNKMLYAFSLEWPQEQLILKTVKPKNRGQIYLMGNPSLLSWKYDSSRGLVINTPGSLRDQFPGDPALPYGFKIEM